MNIYYYIKYSGSTAMNHSFKHKLIFGGVVIALGLTCGFQNQAKAESFSNKLLFDNHDITKTTLAK